MIADMARLNARNAAIFCCKSLSMAWLVGIIAALRPEGKGDTIRDMANIRVIKPFLVTSIGIKNERTGQLLVVTPEEAEEMIELLKSITGARVAPVDGDRNALQEEKAEER